MFDQLHSYITSVACIDPRRGTIVDGGGGWMGGVCMGLVPLCSFLSQNEAENTFHRLLMHRLEMDYKYT